MDFSTLSVDAVLRRLKTAKSGLSTPAATARRKTYGLNQLRLSHRFSWLKNLVGPFKSGFVIILGIAGAISWLTGNRADAIIIGVVITLNAIIEWSQQVSASRVLNSLKRYSSKQVKVRRDHRVIEIDSTELVPGDIMLLAEGEKISADGRLLLASSLSVDESSLTGESMPVTKATKTLDKPRPIYERTNMVFSGTVIQSGRAEAIVTATGNQTQFGGIAKLTTLVNDKPPIVNKIKSLSLRLVIGTLVLAGLTLGLGLARGIAPLEIFRFAVALTVSVIPEGLPVTLTIILLLGIQRMAKKQAFVRRLEAVETLGMVTAIATDKTGTLTKSQLEIAEIWDLDGTLSKADSTDFWLSVSHRHPDLTHPIEALITRFSERAGTERTGWVELDDLPFDANRRFTAVLWAKAGERRVYIKGAPEDILNLCKLSGDQAAKIDSKLAQLTAKNMRVIGVAKKVFTGRIHKLADFKWRDFSFEGFIGFGDELRAEAADAIRATEQAGIKVYMLTGDHLGTALNVGKQIGIIKRSDQIVEGTVLERTTEDRIGNMLERTRVFSRVLPEHKYRLLEALKRSDITAMTGDGVNDVPALVKADIGIAMGSGTDAAKEAADIVLLDNNYATVVEAIKEGRRIYSNVRKMIFFQLSTNLAEALTIISGLLLGMPLALTAAQILWINLITDSTMVIPLGLEGAEPAQMREPPRPPKESLFSNHLFSRLIVIAGIMALISLLTFKLYADQDLQLARTMTFLVLAVVQLANAFNSRSETEYTWKLNRTNRALWVGVGLSLGLLVIAIWGPLQTYMGTAALSLNQLWILIPAVILTLLAGDLHKYWVRRSNPAKS